MTSVRQPSFALKLNPPPPLLYDFFRAFDRADDVCAAFSFPLANDGVGLTTAFVLYDCEGILAKGGEHGTLFSFKGVDDHPAVLMFLQQFCPIGTAGEDYECDDGCGS